MTLILTETKARLILCFFVLINPCTSTCIDRSCLKKDKNQILQLCNFKPRINFGFESHGDYK